MRDLNEEPNQASDTSTAEGIAPEEQILDEALRLPEAGREAFLDHACLGNARLRRLAGALLRAHQQVAEAHTQAVVPYPKKSFVGEEAGTLIGRYKLLQKLGEGGFGSVYLAEQQEPVRRMVALKIIKLGMDTRKVVARFEAERQALALMDHPNIAKVLDGGSTDTGRPYFVMELVKGVPITRYCDDHKFGVRQRLELFMHVCQAVQHAHQKGIIHRDLKPSNVLISEQDGAALPKIIDFGIAKATAGQMLTDKTMFTAFEHFIGTRPYMSPEQTGPSLDIDTRSDIYSLGVLLYELLTGKTPFESKRLGEAGYGEVCRIICEEDPPRPSTRVSTLEASEQTTIAQRRQSDPPNLASVLRGDLDWIVMKALEKNRTRRYETANGLAMDLRRFVHNEPVLARPPSGGYRLRKLIQRHKVVFASSSAVLIALLLGLGLSTWLFIRERAAREQTKIQASRSREVAELLKEMLAGVAPSVSRGRDTTMLLEILDKSAQRVRTALTNQPLVAAELLGVMGRVYCELGELDKAERLHTNALALCRREPLETIELADSMAALASVWRRQGKLQDSEKLLRQALGLRARLHGNKSPAYDNSLMTLAQILTDEGRLREAEKTQRQVIGLRRKYSPEISLEMADAFKGLASILYAQKRLSEAEELDRKALGIERQLAGSNSPEMAMTINDLATVLFLQNRFSEAKDLFREAVLITEKSLSPDHPARLQLMANLATCLGEEGHYAEAEKSQRELLEARRRALGAKHPKIAESLSNLAKLMQAQHLLEEAELNARDALSLRREVLGERNIEVAGSLNQMAGILQEEQKLDEAESSARRALDLNRELRGPDHQEVAASLYTLASVLLRAGKLDAAEQQARAAEFLYQKILPDDWRLYSAQSLRGAILAKQGRYAEAETLLKAGYNGIKERESKISVMNRFRLVQAVERALELYETWGKPDEAARWQAKLAEMHGA